MKNAFNLSCICSLFGQGLFLVFFFCHCCWGVSCFCETGTDTLDCKIKSYQVLQYDYFMDSYKLGFILPWQFNRWNIFRIFFFLFFENSKSSSHRGLELRRKSEKKKSLIMNQHYNVQVLLVKEHIVVCSLYPTGNG